MPKGLFFVRSNAGGEYAYFGIKHHLLELSK